jgi:hypothetical protein
MRSFGNIGDKTMETTTYSNGHKTAIRVRYDEDDIPEDIVEICISQGIDAEICISQGIDAELEMTKVKAPEEVIKKEISNNFVLTVQLPYVLFKCRKETEKATISKAEIETLVKESGIVVGRMFLNALIPQTNILHELMLTNRFDDVQAIIDFSRSLEAVASMDVGIGVSCNLLGTRNQRTTPEGEAIVSLEAMAFEEEV